MDIFNSGEKKFDPLKEEKLSKKERERSIVENLIEKDMVLENIINDKNKSNIEKRIKNELLEKDMFSALAKNNKDIEKINEKDMYSGKVKIKENPKTENNFFISMFTPEKQKKDNKKKGEFLDNISFEDDTSKISNKRKKMNNEEEDGMIYEEENKFISDSLKKNKPITLYDKKEVKEMLSKKFIEKDLIYPFNVYDKIMDDFEKEEFDFNIDGYEDE
jgi:hypothetical protein